MSSDKVDPITKQKEGIIRTAVDVMEARSFLLGILAERHREMTLIKRAKLKEPLAMKIPMQKINEELDNVAKEQDAVLSMYDLGELKEKIQGLQEPAKPEGNKVEANKG